MISEYHLLHKILLSLIDAAGVWLIFWVYFANPKEKINRLFSLLTISILLWVNAGYFLAFSKDVNSALFWARFAPAMVFFFLILLYFFSVYFPQKEKKYFFLDKIILGGGILLSFLSFFTTIIVKGVEFTQWGVNPIFSPHGKSIFYGIVILFTVLSAYQIFRKYFKLCKTEKLKVQYFLIGIFIFIAMNLVFNVFLPLYQKSIQYWQLGNYSAIFLLGFTAYAIVKQGLFGIKVVLTEILVGVIAILLLVNMIGSKSIFEYAWKGTLFVAFLVSGYLLIKSVIREIKLRENLQEAYQRLEELDKAKTEFISIASHQLKGPLGVIKGYLWMILNKKYGSFPKKIKAPLENLFKLNERLVKVVDDLLNLSRLELGKIKLEKEYFQIEEIVYNIYKELSAQAKEKGLKFIIKKPKKELPKIFGDKLKIREAIFNIIDNAIKYTQKGFVKIEFFKKENLIFIKVSDSGIGFSQEEAKNIFQSFRRIKRGAVLHTEGAGLGLYIAKKFIELHKGRVWAKSKGKNKGATFFIALPI